MSADELEALERIWPEGMPLAAIVDFLLGRGIQMTEGTFRKYVQLGLLPRSRRVGRKGKHRGSHGLYPVDSAARVIEIKALMEAGLTLEEIQRSALAVGAEVDVLRRTAEDIISRLEQALAELDDRPPLPSIPAYSLLSAGNNSQSEGAKGEKASPAAKPERDPEPGAGEDSKISTFPTVKRPKRTRELVDSLVNIRTLTEQLVRAMEIATVEICASAVGPPEAQAQLDDSSRASTGGALPEAWKNHANASRMQREATAKNFQRPVTPPWREMHKNRTSVALLRTPGKQHEEHEE